ncbi:MAG: hypothetical protein KDK28_00695 [Maritimibacter sp.]|nr:hypothetical protein [Maritimibacter sp.]
MRRLMFLILALVGLTACAAEPKWAPDADVAAAHVVTSNPPTLSLITVINVNSGNGGHSALIVDASERVLFDPAGSFYHPRLPERNDVVYGMTDAAVDVFIDFHSRESWRVVRQDLVVPAAVASQALALVKANGAVPKAFCANSISGILSQLPGFGGISSTMFPVALMRQFAEYPGVVTREYHDMDPDTGGEIIARGI